MLDLLQKSQRLELRGGPSDPAVLVTADRTYDVRLVETSNSLLLVDPDNLQPMQLSVRLRSQTPSAQNGAIVSADGADADGSSKRQRVMAVQIVGTATRTYELVEKPPSLQQLVQKLAPTQQAPIPEDDDDKVGDEDGDRPMQDGEAAGGDECKQIGSGPDRRGVAAGFTWPQLTALIQASDEQLRRALLEIDGVRTPAGCWRLIPDDQLALTFDAILTAGGLMSRHPPLEPRFLVRRCHSPQVPNHHRFLLPSSLDVCLVRS